MASNCWRRHVLLVGVFLVWMVALLGGVQGFNVDVEQATLYTGGTEQSSRTTRPQRDTMFGFSLDQHITHTGSRRLVVGAPKAQTSQPGITQGGAVFNCGVAGPGASISCSRLDFDTTGNNVHDEGIGEGPKPIESKSHQWFGATVVSARNSFTGDILACAPRYTYFSTNLDKILPIGHCFHFRGSMHDFIQFNPIKNTVEFYQERDSKSLEQYSKEGKAMLGFSADISPDGNTFLAGAVGSYSWKGRLYAQTLKQDHTTDRSTKTGPYESSIYNEAYMAYAVAVGNFSQSIGHDYVVSAPRAGGEGPRDDSLSGQLRIYNSSMKMHRLIIGEQMGEYLGQSLAVGDFNGDGLDDLAAGAPFYGEKRDMPNTGRVIVLYQKRLGYIHNKRQTITGQGRAGEQFGLSLATVGDINNDGYIDLAVGAPYGGVSGHGAVYIFHGSRAGIKGKYTQVIDADVISGTLRTFGYSLAGGLDLDRNDYPDITVGSYASDSIVQLWSRPVLRLHLNVSVPSSVNLKDTSMTLPGGIQVTSFPVELQYRYEGKNPRSRAYLNITVRLDSAREAAPRAYFNAPDGRTTTYNRAVWVQGSQGEYTIPIPHAAYVKTGLRDKLTPITVEVTYDVSVMVDSGLAEIFDADIPTTIREEVHIEKNCGDDRTCVADLTLSAQGITKEFLLGESNIELKVEVSNIAEDDAFEAQVAVHLPPDTTYSRIHHVTAPVAVRCSPRSDSRDPDMDDDSQGDRDVFVTVVCDIGNPLPGNSEVEFTLVLDASKSDGSMDYLPFSLNTSSSNPENDTTTGDNWADVTIPVKASTPIRLSGISKPEQVLFSPNDSSISQRKSDNSITHLYELRNLGPSTIQTASVYIYWPSRFEEEDGEALFVITGVPKVRQDQTERNCTIVSTPPQPQNASDSANPATVSRTRRSTPSFTEKFSQPKVVNKAVVCEPGAKESWCSIISCQVTTLEADERALIEIDAKLATQSLAQFPQMTILVASQAMAKVESVPYDGVPVEPSHKIHRVDTILATKGAGQAGVKIWVIGVSVASGILVLIILILLLWKCGFFKRSRYGDNEGMLNSVDDNEMDKSRADEDEDDEHDEEEDMFPEGEAGNRNSRIDTINKKLILQNGISLSIEEKR